MKWNPLKKAFFLATLFIVSVWAVTRIPRRIEAQLVQLLSSYGVIGEVRLSRISPRGVSVDVFLKKPIVAKVPTLRVELRGWSQFHVVSQESDEPIQVPLSSKQWIRVFFRNLEVSGLWNWKKLALEVQSARAEAETNGAIDSRVLLDLGKDFSRPSGRIEAEVFPRGQWAGSFRSSLKMCWHLSTRPDFSELLAEPCQQQSVFFLKFPQIPVFRINWRNAAILWAHDRASTQGEFRFSNEGASGKLSFDLKQDLTRVVLVTKASFHLGNSSIKRTLKRFKILGTDFKNSDFEVVLKIVAPWVGKTHRVRQDAPWIVQAALRTEISEGVAHGVPLRGLLLSTAIRCEGEFRAPILPLASCRFDDHPQPLLVEAERIGKTQPLRDLKVVLNQELDGAFAASWQGAVLQGDFSHFKMKSFGSSSGTYQMTIKNLSLSEILRAIDRPDLRGNGTLEGKALMRWDTEKGFSEGFWIDPAGLNSVGSGVIQYGLKGQSPPVETLAQFQSLLKQGQQALVLRAFENFEFHTLFAKISRSPQNFSKIELKISGKNPTLARGQPFEISIPIEGNLESLIINAFIRDFSDLSEFD